MHIPSPQLSKLNKADKSVEPSRRTIAALPLRVGFLSLEWQTKIHFAIDFSRAKHNFILAILKVPELPRNDESWRRAGIELTSGSAQSVAIEPTTDLDSGFSLKLRAARQLLDN
jgi:hypothetical protein